MPPPGPRSCWDPSINAKAYYVFSFASFVAIGPFMNVYFYDSGLSKAQVGLIGALRPWVSAPAAFLWTALADRLDAHRLVLMATFVAAVAARMLLLLPRGFGGLLAVVLLAQAVGAPVGALADAAVMRLCKKDTEYGKFRLWGAVGWGAFSTVAGWLISHLGIRWAFYSHALLSVPCLFLGARLYDVPTAAEPGALAGAAPGASQLEPQGPRRGRSRSSSSSGSEAGDLDPLLAVKKSDTLDQFDVKQRAAGGPGAYPAGATAGSVEHGVREPGSVAEAGVVGGKRPWSEDLLLLLRRPKVVLFIWTALTMGYGFGTIDSFLFLYLEQLGASGTLMGLTLTITCAAEVPAFQLQDRLLDRYGVTRVLDLVQAVYVLRMALYACLPLMGNVLWVLPIELLHGVTFALGWGAGTVNCKQLAPPGLAATLQGTFQGLYFGLGYGLGSLVGGYLGSRLGWQGMFACSSAMMLCFWLLVMAARAAVTVWAARSAGTAAGTAYVELRQGERQEA
ncbi:Major facilitator superfamily domain-containing protein 6 [Tetrabaena socialis]|uniref:Major facilitator superfamily domain-containing protein 6 n=1 Tax=Tetrabaena socialis TaxID=47790 RepID=A0A2J8A009_9CHLO|nr:Major facilitator superfamily domain-containing protein 6 [Tetrabaena socialis]|eukprot:PNH05854.1 Major facilitator superfamily domain-containing protein 6 [Tetrabaena socialis]